MGSTRMRLLQHEIRRRMSDSGQATLIWRSTGHPFGLQSPKRHNFTVCPVITLVLGLRVFSRPENSVLDPPTTSLHLKNAPSLHPWTFKSVSTVRTSGG